MTDKEALYRYRLEEAVATLADAEKMATGGCTPRSITNRAYYATFYAALALFLRDGVLINTSKHSGVISIFDRDFIKTGKLDKTLSEILHALFDKRQESDYVEMIVLTIEDAKKNVELARKFVTVVEMYINR